MMRNNELILQANRLYTKYVRPWIARFNKMKKINRENEARAYFAFKFQEVYNDAACDEKVFHALTDAVVWLGGFDQFLRNGCRGERAEFIRLMKQKAQSSHKESLAQLQLLMPIIEQIFIHKIDPLIAKLSS